MDRVFLDANVLFSAAYAANAGLHRLWNLRNVILCSSRYALEEARLNLSNQEQRQRLHRLSPAVELFEALARELPRHVSLPDKDVPILLAAFAAKATHLLTGDIRHFGAYFGTKIEGVLVQAPGDYLKGKTKGRQK